jgi:hypothetical protein
MSTYGKKALTHWKYEGKNSQEELTRFNNTPYDIQEEILKKWYPIGFTCKKTSKGSTEYYGQYKLIVHVKLCYGWRVETIDENLDKDKSRCDLRPAVHPGNLIPDKVWQREEKLKEIGI